MKKLELKFIVTMEYEATDAQKWWAATQIEDAINEHTLHMERNSSGLGIICKSVEIHDE